MIVLGMQCVHASLTDIAVCSNVFWRSDTSATGGLTHTAIKAVAFTLTVRTVTTLPTLYDSNDQAQGDISQKTRKKLKHKIAKALPEFILYRLRLLFIEE